MLRPYDHCAAVSYAHRWAFGRNPAYYDYEDMGGDCTNFASQCLYAGARVMNFTPTFGWYYRDPNDKAPAWTGVEFFRNFLLREGEGPGPVGELCRLSALRPGDFVQLMGGPDRRWTHTLVVVSTARRPSLRNTLVAAHSNDTDYRPLARYRFRDLRFLHITGVRA